MWDIKIHMHYVDYQIVFNQVTFSSDFLDHDVPVSFLSGSLLPWFLTDLHHVLTFGIPCTNPGLILGSPQNCKLSKLCKKLVWVEFPNVFNTALRIQRTPPSIVALPVWCVNFSNLSYTLEDILTFLSSLNFYKCHWYQAPKSLWCLPHTFWHM